MEDEQFKNVTECRYHGYFTNSDHKYLHSDAWWRVMLSKVVFVLVFEHLVFFILMIIQYVIPDVPDSVTLHVARNRYVNKIAAYKVLSFNFLVSHRYHRGQPMKLNKRFSRANSLAV